MHSLIVGLSTRAMAESAYRGGHRVATLDYFGDSDQRALVENHSLMRDYGESFTVSALVEIGRALGGDALVYASSLENHPRAVADLTQDRLLLGNLPRVLERVRDWALLRTFCAEANISAPKTLLPGEEGLADRSARWLRKPVHSGGGLGVNEWDHSPLAENHILQAYADGIPASAAFVADGARSVLLGVTEQLIGRRELGSDGFTWCGNIFPLDLGSVDGRALEREVERIISRLTERFELRGVNGIDFVVSTDAEGRHRPVLIEVNPRYTASMELMEQAYGMSIFSLHVHGAQGRLPATVDLQSPETTERSRGKAIVYARSTVIVPETKGWVSLGRRDVPYPGDRIEGGRPVCTVFAAGESRTACWLRLVEAARALREEIGDQMGGRP